MSRLPRSIPVHFTLQLHAALTAAGVDFDPTLAPGSRITHTVTHQGRTWNLRYIDGAGDAPIWQLFGPGDYEWGPTAETAEAVEAITAPVPEPEPEPIDPHPRAPRTHLGVDVPEFVRAEWDSERAQWWRLGVATAVGKLPDTRPRS